MPLKSTRRPLLLHLDTIWPDMSRQDIYAAILCGEVYVDGELVRDSRALVSSDSDFFHESKQFVSRGGVKLNSVLDNLDFHPEGKVCIDAGTSTGGFTDCLLQRGAGHIHAIDVGYNQIAWKLRTHPEVTIHEKTNIMSLNPGYLKPPAQLAVADLAFRSIRGAAAHILKLIGGGHLLALIKPQFENPRETNFNGVVKTMEARREVLFRLKEDLEMDEVFIHDAIVSPLTGRRGNVEVFFLLSTVRCSDEVDINQKIDRALETGMVKNS